ncbi:MAG: GntR family transcriptional regulator, partial [Kiloniellales bacterium]|nr:GntR family transcriptional regulator [Kiloniellales bacterium]
MTEAKGAARSTRAADGLIQIFEKQILDGTLRDGQPLPPEREIVQTYGVSRTVVREAVLALSNKG